MPGSTAWETASPMSAWRRKTRNGPSRPQAVATRPTVTMTVRSSAVMPPPPRGRPPAGRRLRSPARRARRAVGLARVGQTQPPAVLEPRRPLVAPGDEVVRGIRAGRGEHETASLVLDPAPGVQRADTAAQRPLGAAAAQRELLLRRQRPAVRGDLEVQQHAVDETALAPQQAGAPGDTATRRQQNAQQHDGEADEHDDRARGHLGARGQQRPRHPDERARPQGAAGAPGARRTAAPRPRA